MSACQTGPARQRRNPMNVGPGSIPGRSAADRHPDLTPSWVVVGLAMGPAVAIGLARFAYALLLPPMRADLGWSFAQAGAMNTANAGGYLIGALAAAPLGGRMGDKTIFAVGLVLTALTVGASGLTADFTVLSVLRVAAGFTGALAFVCGAGLTSAAAMGGSRNRAPTLLGVYFAGAGMGVTASALAVPPLLERVGWRGGWLVLGALALAATAFGLLALRRAPEAFSGLGGLRAKGLVAAIHGVHARGLWALRRWLHRLCDLHRRLFAQRRGFLRRRRHTVLVDIGPVFGRRRIRVGAHPGPTEGRLGNGGHTRPSHDRDRGAARMEHAGRRLSVRRSLRGLVSRGPRRRESFARRVVKPHAVTAAIATLTVVFGIGQCIGPVLSGALSDGPNGLKAGLWLSVGILAAGAVVAAFQREPAGQP